MAIVVLVVVAAQRETRVHEAGGRGEVEMQGSDAAGSHAEPKLKLGLVPTTSSTSWGLFSIGSAGKFNWDRAAQVHVERLTLRQHQG